MSIVGDQPNELSQQAVDRAIGAHGGSAVVAARQAGMELAMTTDRGGNDLRRADPLRLRRINVGGRASVPLVRAQLAWAAGLDARRSSD